MDYIESKIKEARTNIKQNSLKAYLSNIRKIFREVFDNNIDIKNFNKFTQIKKYLETLTPATRKNIMTAIMVFLKANNSSDALIKKYQDYYSELIEDYENNYDKQVKSDKENKNWITQKELEKKRHELAALIDKMDLDDLNRKDEDIIQQHLVLMLYSLIPPIRNDYAQMKVYENHTSKNENFINLKNKEIILNKYKTDKTYGMKKINIPNELIKLIKRWINISQSNYLLINIYDRKPMTNNGLTKYLNKIFKPKKVSTTLLRKLYLSEKYPVIHNRKDMKQDAYIMGHSIDTQQGIYRKK